MFISLIPSVTSAVLAKQSEFHYAAVLNMHCVQQKVEDY